ncbi:MAG: hypothetical protein KDI88_07515 [Gammaproteobacteria bacterium]|nr:hypothetical protein [Gammaproteobacteria bacterium]
MSDLVKQPGNVGRVNPLTGARDAGRRKKAPQSPGRREAHDKPHDRKGQRGDRVDEYV